MTPQIIQQKLDKKAAELSKDFNGAPIVIVVGGSKKANVPRCMAGKANLGEGREGRLRDLLGILETVKQIETLRHFGYFKLLK